MIRATELIIGLATIALANVSGCGRDASTAPPDIQYGASVCAECNMIISDERFASALIIDGERGVETLLFDDIGDQIRFEQSKRPQTILARWAHDHDSLAWIHAEDAVYLHAEALHTPMASGIAAFADRASAERLQDSVGGEIKDFEALWSAP